ncbi:hypothetical protein [Streptomyces sp. NPDC055681]
MAQEDADRQSHPNSPADAVAALPRERPLVSPLIDAAIAHNKADLELVEGVAERLAPSPSGRLRAGPGGRADGAHVLAPTATITRSAWSAPAPCTNFASSAGALA